jgi:uncharacterized protein (TIGR03435 family)
MMTDDMALVREYAERNSEEAFATLVSRYVNLVYSVALQQVHDSHLAEEITQAVFVILARKAKSLGAKTILSGWLCRTARYACANALKIQHRRQRREQEAYMQSTLNEPEPEDAWAQIAPLLGAALAQLGQKDHDAIVLRFFDGKSMNEVGAALGVSENLARTRVSRALEKLRKFFMQRGVAFSTTVMASAISANSVQAAPIGLATSAVATAKGTAVATSTLTIIKGTLKIMAWTKAKTAIVVGVGVLLAAGTAKVAITQIAAHQTQIWQEKYDLSVLDLVAPQTKILPSPPSRTATVHLAGQNKKGQRVGWGRDVPEILMAAYGYQFDSGRLIFSAPVPEGRYDFISNLPQGQSEAMQQEIKKQFGLVGRREMIETNVLILKIRNANPTGLKLTSGGKTNFEEGPGSLVMRNQNLFSFVEFLQRNLGILVMNRTKFSNDLDIDLNWDGTAEGLKQATLDQLGLELVPAKEPVEFLVVEKAN